MLLFVGTSCAKYIAHRGIKTLCRLFITEYVRLAFQFVVERSVGMNLHSVGKVALFVITDDCGEICTFSREVADSAPETLRAVLGDEGFTAADVHEYFIIEGALYTPGRESLE